ncbi:hypothetical protein [Escherichia coli]|uniref:hypothetical protein n=1 Tax=Escherichia coli TaxID=562 RepID=UPI003D811442
MILWPMKKETDIRRGRHCVFLKHIAVRYYDKGVLWSPGYFVSSCILTYQLDLITTISAPNRISNVISIPLIIPSTSCNFPTLELHIVQTPDAKKSHVHF